MTLDNLQSISQQATISAISPRFHINFPNHDKVFTPHFNHVTGKAYFKFIDTFNCLVSVQVGLRGIIQLCYSKESVDHKNKILSNHYENHLLFDETSYVLTTMSNTGLVFKTGRTLNAAFDLSFPNDIIEKLPSSCLNLGLSPGSTLAHVNVIYQLYFKVNFLTNGTPDYMEYTTPITYQGEGTTYDNSAAPETFFVFDKNVFIKKMKKYFSNSNGFIVENKEITDPRKKPSFVRKLFDSKYRSTYKNLLAKDVQLNAFAAIPKDFNLASTLDQIDMLFEVPNISNFDEFLVGSQPTELGLFEIESINLTINQDLEFSMNDGFEYATIFNNVIPLYNKDTAGPDSDPKFIEVADFTYSQERATYCLQITLAQILGNHERIIGGAWKDKQSSQYNSDWKDSIMQDVQLQTFFSNINSLTLTMKIGNAQIKDNQSYEYNFKCDSRIVCHYDGLPEESPAVKQFGNPEKQPLIERNFKATGKFCEICNTGTNVVFEDCTVEVSNSKVPMMISGGVIMSKKASALS